MASQHDEKHAVDVDFNNQPHDVGEVVQLAEDVESQELSPWTLHMFRLYGVLAFAYLCGCLVS